MIFAFRVPLQIVLVKVDITQIAGRIPLGLVAEVHPPEKVLDRAREIARHILRQPEMIRRYTRQVTIEPIRRLYSDFMEHGFALEGLGAWGGWPLTT